MSDHDLARCREDPLSCPDLEEGGERAAPTLEQTVCLAPGIEPGLCDMYEGSEIASPCRPGFCAVEAPREPEPPAPRPDFSAPDPPPMCWCPETCVVHPAPPVQPTPEPTPDWIARAARKCYDAGLLNLGAYYWRDAIKVERIIQAEHAAASPLPASPANCGCVYHAEQGIPCPHDLPASPAPAPECTCGGSILMCRACGKYQTRYTPSQREARLVEAIGLLRANLVGVLQVAEGVAHTSRTAAALAIENADVALGGGSRWRVGSR